MSVSRTLLLAAACAAASVVSAAPSMQTLFEAGVGYPPCYRQPALVVIDSSHLVVFAEGRNNTYCSGTNDGFPMTIVARASWDGGATWTATQDLFVGGADFLAGVYEQPAGTNVNGTVHLFIQTGSSITYVKTTDLGATYSKPTTQAINGPTGYTWIPAVGHGITIDGSLCVEPTCGGTAGRLLVPMVCNQKKGAAGIAELKALRAHQQQRQTTRMQAGMGGGDADVVCPGCYSCLMWSDNPSAGQWSIGAIASQQGSRESALVQLHATAAGTAALLQQYAGHPVAAPSKAVIYASERNMGNSTGYRLHSISVDSGASYTIAGADHGLPDSKVTNWTGIVSGCTRFDSPGATRVVFSTPANPTARADYTIFTSTDETASWNSGKLWLSGPAGYSDSAQLNATHVALVLENGDQQFAQRISFATFTANDL